MRVRKPSPITLLFCLLLAVQFQSSAITVEDLKSIPNLTPQKFAACFSNFSFQYRAEVQAPDVFLATESGDCDDFATLAADVLKDKGYTPRLIAVRMTGLVHVVCYIEETHTYLDFNNRDVLRKTVSCGSNLNEIADKVAKSFDSRWTSASEFTYADRMKRLVATAVEANRTLASAKPATAPRLFSFLVR
jgi:hypothetical protein